MQFLDIVIQLPAHRIKRITDCDVGILMLLLVMGLMIHDQFAVRDMHVDFHSVQISLMMLLMRSFDNDATGMNAIESLFQLRNLGLDVRAQCVGRIHVSIVDFDG